MSYTNYFFNFCVYVRVISSHLQSSGYTVVLGSNKLDVEKVLHFISV